MKCFSSILFNFFFLLPIVAQSVKGVDFFGKSGNTSICDQVSNFRSQEEAEEIVANILDKVGLKPNFGVTSCPGINNCQAVVINGIPYIIYDVQFLEKVKGFSFTTKELPSDNLNTDWSSLAILAHEIGHHLNQHLTNKWIQTVKSSRELELEADEFAGHVLCQLGATLQQSQQVMYSDLVSENGNFSHPPRAERLNAIKTGWEKNCTTDNYDNELVLVTEQVMVSPEYIVYDILPDRYETVSEQFMVKGPEISKRTVEQILLKESGNRFIAEEPVFEIRKVSYLYKPATSNSPAEYRSYTVRTLVKEQIITEIPIPAEYTTITQEPGSGLAEYKTLTKQVLASPSTLRERTVPAEYKTIERYQLK